MTVAVNFRAEGAEAGAERAPQRNKESGLSWPPGQIDLTGRSDEKAEAPGL